MWETSIGRPCGVVVELASLRISFNSLGSNSADEINNKMNLTPQNN
jgi:hypothetical protein